MIQYYYLNANIMSRAVLGQVMFNAG